MEDFKHNRERDGGLSHNREREIKDFKQNREL